MAENFLRLHLACSQHLLHNPLRADKAEKIAQKERQKILDKTGIFWYPFNIAMKEEFAIKVDNVSKTFRIPHEKISSLRGALHH